MKTIDKYQIERYQSSLKEEWDVALGKAINGVFLFYRSYVDYHSHRFLDHSLVVRDDSKIIALLPANELNGVIYSHQGLTYGGWIYCKRLNAIEIEELFVLLEDYCRRNGIVEIMYKHKPSIFSTLICETDAWMMWHRGYDLWRRDLNFVIDLQKSPGFAHDKHYRLNKAHRNNLRIEEEGNIKQLMKLVAHNLDQRFGIIPTHTTEEAELLQRRFPENIHTINLFQEEKFLGGVWLFVDNLFIHTQYLHSNDDGKELCAIEFLLSFLIEKYSETKRYLSFGTSTEMDGKILNGGLASFKEGFGATGVCHDFYRKKIG